MPLRWACPARRQLSTEFRACSRGRGPSGAERQRLAFDAFHDEIIHPVLMAYVMSDADVRMIRLEMVFARDSKVAAALARQHADPRRYCPP